MEPRAYSRLYRAVVQQPEVVTLCGSVRFANEFTDVHRRLSLQGCAVFVPAVPVPGSNLSDEDVEMLRELHRRKIDLSDRVHVVNPGGYVGETTSAEIAYAEARGIPVTYERDVT